VQELRDVADWQRWANIGIQEQLCEKMEALKAVEDPEEIAKHVRDLQEQWRQAADVPRAQGEALWRRFKAAHDAAWARCEAHFAAQAEARAANLAMKVALCERAESLADSTRWIQTADEIKKL
jgi:exonuclease SbcC